MRKLVLFLLVTPVLVFGYMRHGSDDKGPSIPEYIPAKDAPKEAEITASFKELIDCHRLGKTSCSKESKALRAHIRYHRRAFNNHGQEPGILRFFFRVLKELDEATTVSARIDLGYLLQNEVGLVTPVLRSAEAGQKLLDVLDRARSPRVAQTLAWLLGAYLTHPDPDIKKGLQSLLARAKSGDEINQKIRTALFSRLEGSLSKQPEFLPLLFQRLKDPKEHTLVRRQIAAILHQMNDSEHRSEVTQALMTVATEKQGEDTSIRDMAIRTLGRTKAIEKLSELLSLIEETPEDLNLHRSLAVALPFFAESPNVHQYLDIISNTAIQALSTEGLGKTAYKHAVKAIVRSKNPNAIELLRPFALRKDRYIGPSAQKAINKLEKTKSLSK